MITLYLENLRSRSRKPSLGQQQPKHWGCMCDGGSQKTAHPREVGKLWCECHPGSHKQMGTHQFRRIELPGMSSHPAIWWHGSSEWGWHHRPDGQPERQSGHWDLWHHGEGDKMRSFPKIGRKAAAERIKIKTNYQSSRKDDPLKLQVVLIN